MGIIGVCAQRVAPDDLFCGGSRCGRRYGAGTLYPDTTDLWAPLGVTGIVDRVGIEQHLGFILQTQQPLQIALGFAALGCRGACVY